MRRHPRGTGGGAPHAAFRAPAALVALGILGLAAACSTDGALLATGLPGRTAARIDLIAERGDYLDVNVTAGGATTRFFLPDDENCRAVFASEADLSYANSGLFGQLRTDETTCDPIGVLSLARWRDRRPHHQAAAVIPRDLAQLREQVYADEDLSLVRGRFRLAVQVGLMGGEDILAVIPNVPACQGLTIPGQATMEFRPSGKRVMSLLADGALCDVLGFVLPPPGPAP